MLTKTEIFNEAYYLAQNLDVAAAVNAGQISSALVHLEAFGKFENRDPGAGLNSEYYLAQNLDVAAAVNAGEMSSALDHFLAFGQYEGRSPSVSFNNKFYLQNNPDVAAAVALGDFSSGFEHFYRFGIFELRDPSSLINLSDLDDKNSTFSMARSNKDTNTLLDLIVNDTNSLIAANAAPTNDTPEIADVSSSVAFAELEATNSAQLIDTTITLTDNSDNFDTGTLTITYSVGGAAGDNISVRNQGTGAGQISFDGTNVSYEGTVIGAINGANNGLTGSDLIFDLNSDSNATSVEALLENLTYQNSAGSPAASRTISIVLNDGDLDSDAATVAISISANAASSITGLAAPAGFAENSINALGQIIDSTITISDADNVNYLNGALTVTYSVGGGAEDFLTVLNQGTGAGQISFDGANVSYGGTVIGALNGVNNGFAGVDLVIDLNVNATIAAVEALVENITYRNDDNAPNATRTISITLNDGVDDSAAVTAVITVNAEGDNKLLSALDGSNGSVMAGVGGFTQLGSSVNSAGDVNGDGFDDFIIGAQIANITGQSYVVFGKAAGWVASTDVTALDGTDGFRMDGVSAGGYLGSSVSSAGDVNGDGFDDIIMTGWKSNGNTGEGFVVFGKAAGWAATLDLATLDGSTGFKFDGIDASDRLGAVGEAGDINGDGFDDIVIGAWEADPGGINYSGETYVVFGKAAGWIANIDLSALDGNTGFVLNGTDAYGISGISVASAGDINGDGFDDVIVGSRAGGTYRGETYIVFGKAAGWAASTDLSTLDGTIGFRLDGVDDDDRSGYSVSSAGDINGDGFDDVLIGGWGGDPGGDSSAGESYVVFGKAAGWAASTNLSTLDGTNGFRLDGIDAGDRSGESVKSAGDFNGDGFDDIIIGAGYADPDADDEGETYLIFGKAAGWAASIDLSTLDGTIGFRLDGINIDDRSGGNIGGAGDVNGDGFDDIIIGAEDSDSGGNASGAAYIIFGNNESGAATHVGTSGADTIGGSAGDDVIVAGRGADVITGGAGADVIKAAFGDDTVTGGAGVDKLYGGAGADDFIYTATSESGTGSGSRDIIYDFETTSDDIDLSGFAGTFSYLGAGAFTAGAAPEVRYVATGNNSVVQVDFDGDGTADFEIELLDTMAMVAGDFIL